MRVSFEKIILDDAFDIRNKIYYISGNEETLIHKVEKNLIEKFSRTDDFYIDRVEAINEEENNNLFFQKKLTILNNPKGLDKRGLDNYLKNNNNLIVVCENSKGDIGLKKIFEKENNLILIFCYELSRDQKVKILNFYIN